MTCLIFDVSLDKRVIRDVRASHDGGARVWIRRTPVPAEGFQIQTRRLDV